MRRSVGAVVRTCVCAVLLSASGVVQASAEPTTVALPPRVQLSDFHGAGGDSVARVHLGDGVVLSYSTITRDRAMLYFLGTGRTRAVEGAFQLEDRTVYIARAGVEHTEIHAMDAYTGDTRLLAVLPGAHVEEPQSRIDVAGDCVAWWVSWVPEGRHWPRWDLRAMDLATSSVTTLSVGVDAPRSVRASSSHLIGWEGWIQGEYEYEEGPSGFANALTGMSVVEADQHGFDSYDGELAYRSFAFSWDTLRYTEELWLVDASGARTMVDAIEHARNIYPVPTGTTRGPALDRGRVAWNQFDGMRLYDLASGTYVRLGLVASEYDLYGDDLVYADGQDGQLYWQSLAAASDSDTPSSGGTVITGNGGRARTYAQVDSSASTELTASAQPTASVEPTVSAETSTSGESISDAAESSRATTEVPPEDDVNPWIVWGPLGLIVAIGGAAWVVRLRRAS